MKRMRKWGAGLLAMVLLVALMVPAMAEPEPVSTKGSIEISNAVNGKTYEIYRIFDLEGYNEDFTSLLYTINKDWEAFFAEGGAGAEYITLDHGGHVIWAKESTESAAAEFAKKAKDYAESLTAVESVEAANGVAKFTGLEFGYYLVSSSLGSVCALNTTTPVAKIQEKNSDSSNEKQVKEDSTGAWGTKNDADIGDAVEFKSTIQVKDGAPKGYVFHDSMSKGLSFEKDVAVKRTRGKGTVVLTEETDYTVTTEGLEDGCTFEVTFADSALQPNDVLEVTYSATLNEKATIKGANPNESYITYGEKGKTEASKTETYTWQLDVQKVYTDSVTQKDQPLAGAKFALYRVGSNGNEYLVTSGSGSDYTVNGWTAAGLTPEEPVEGVTYASVMVTPKNGELHIKGLDSGTYYLKEVEAPAGFHLLDEDVTVTINGEGTVSSTYGQQTLNGTVVVRNIPGAKLPSTGGIGTTIFYALGGTLVLAAGVYFCAGKTRKEAV